MPMQKLAFKPGIVRDVTALAAEGGWYDCDKVRFRLGFPQNLGGWSRVSADVYIGTCRSLSCWRTLIGDVLTGVGTHIKMYIEYGGAYYDITPVRDTAVIAANAFTTSNGLSVVEVNDVSHGASNGDYVVISASGAAVGGIAAAAFEGSFVITVVDADNYTITVPATASSTATGGNATFTYLYSVGAEYDTATSGWGSGGYGSGSWGGGSVNGLRIWNQVPYGEDLVFGARGAELYYWDATGGSGALAVRGTKVSSMVGASSVPLFQNGMFLEASARILVLLGSNAYGTTTLDPLLVRWSDAESVVEWAPSSSNSAGEYRLTDGSQIVAAVQTRTETLILTDTAAVSMQYLGAGAIFGFTQQSKNISVAGPHACAAVGSTVFWMGHDKFYVYDGRVQTLPCSVRDQVFDDVNIGQGYQFFAGTNEAFDEVWWFYCSADSTTPDRYVVYNHVEKLWFYGTLNRTAWLDTPLKEGPLAATAISNLVVHEVGVDDASTATTAAIESYIESADFDIGDGHNYAFVDKVLPDMAFVGSTAATPTTTLTVSSRNNPGSGYRASPDNDVTRTSVTATVEQWTEIVYVRLRGRQLKVRIGSNSIGVHWRMGTPRINVRPDGRRA